jgi:hypothetical protein
MFWFAICISQSLTAAPFAATRKRDAVLLRRHFARLFIFEITEQDGVAVFFAELENRVVE